MNHRFYKHPTRKKTKRVEKELSDVEEEQNQRIRNKAITKEKAMIRKRQENSLSELTKNFINFINSQSDKTININDVVKKLKVKKRRIYDITNVLEGIGYIQKQGKNKIEWVKEYIELDEEIETPIKEDNISENSSVKNESDQMGKPDDINDNSDYLKISEIENLKKEIEEINNEEERLDSWINQIKTSFEKLNEDKSFKEYGYVTFDDIKAITLNEDINLIAVKACQGTSVEIPDPEQINKIYLQTYENMRSGREEYDQSLLDSLSKKYQIFLDSPKGEINVYLVLSKNEDQTSTSRALSAFHNSSTGFANFHGKSLNNVLQQNNSYKNLERSKNYSEMKM